MHRTIRRSSRPTIRRLGLQSAGVRFPGLAADPAAVGTVYAVSDSYYGTSRIYMLDVSTSPARIMAYVDLKQDGQPFAYNSRGSRSVRRRVLGGL